MQKSYNYYILFLILPWFATQSCVAQQHLTSVFEALTKNEGEKMTLEMDLTTITAQKRSDQYFPAAIISGDGTAFKVEVRPRGKFRRKNAFYPPLKLKFKKKELLNAGFDTLNEIKLVLPCYENQLGDELVIREYLAYKIYERLSPASVRARLIKLTIHDTHVEKSKKTMYAILVEDEEETCARIGGSPVEQYGISPDSLHTNQAALMVVFEYMIGNTDWEISMLRNVRLVKGHESSKIIVMPYDFDFSGLVSAPYSSPASDTGLKTVRDRFLMPSGIKPESLKRALSLIRKSKSDIYAICQSKYLSRDAVEDISLFLDTFFDKIAENDEMPQLLKMPESD
jgi:hypothetical protein